MANHVENTINKISEGCHVLLKKADNMRLFQVQRKREIWLDKTKFFLDGMIGYPYGTTFEVKDRQMVKISKVLTLDKDVADKGIDQDKDNRNLHDSDSNQKLTADEIDQLKKEGVTGEKLIEQLIENSATYQNKTEYAQEKWVKKKKKKHVLEYTVLKPTSRLLCELYWSKGPAKICNLRLDTLAQILAWGNVRAHSTVGVIDTCLGLVTGAVLERLQGFGKVVSFYHGGNPMRSPLEAYDFSQEVKDSLYHFPLELVNSLQASDETSITDNNQASVLQKPEVAITECASDKSPDIPDTEKNGESNDLDNSESIGGKVAPEMTAEEDQIEIETGKKGKGRKRKNFKEREAAREERIKEIESARSVLKENKLDCLIVACKFHPTPIVTALVDCVAPSRQIVVFSQFKEALEDCYVYLRENGGLVNYRLTETWLRNYQVLPNRTHPVIQMSGTGGYLLTATTIVKQ